MIPGKRRVHEIERRYGDEVRTQFGIDPAALTRDEATYILDFQNADALRDRAGKAQGQRSERLRAKGIQEEGVATNIADALRPNGISENLKTKVAALEKVGRKVGDFTITSG